VSLDGLSLLSVGFSSEAYAVLNFFAYFFLSRKKSMWGAGLAPIKYDIILFQLPIFKNEVL